MLLVFEEAHNYVPNETGDRTAFAKIAVERVAKEGRKYGVSAMIVSQRPSELSETVLAQCNSFVAMRMNNPDDQHYVEKVVSDHFSGLLNMLPVLRPGEAFVIGDSVIMPMRTLVNRPDPEPLSANIDFFQHWSESNPDYDIDEIIKHWRAQNRRAVEEIEEVQPTFDAPIPPASGAKHQLPPGALPPGLRPPAGGVRPPVPPPPGAPANQPSATPAGIRRSKWLAGGS